MLREGWELGEEKLNHVGEAELGGLMKQLAQSGSKHILEH